MSSKLIEYFVCFLESLEFHNFDLDTVIIHESLMSSFPSIMSYFLSHQSEIKWIDMFLFYMNDAWIITYVFDSINMMDSEDQHEHPISTEEFQQYLEKTIGRRFDSSTCTPNPKSPHMKIVWIQLMNTLIFLKNEQSFEQNRILTLLLNTSPSKFKEKLPGSKTTSCLWPRLIRVVGEASIWAL